MPSKSLRDGRVFLVTGSTGNAGGAVVGALARDGHPVRALVRDGSDQTIGHRASSVYSATSIEQRACAAPRWLTFVLCFF
jgi:NAD(P)-dependent dehydrogenase (short-subunit alcohol dehydrogenase family)